MEKGDILIVDHVLLRDRHSVVRVETVRAVMSDVSVWSRDGWGEPRRIKIGKRRNLGPQLGGNPERLRKLAALVRVIDEEYHDGVRALLARRDRTLAAISITGKEPE